VGYFKGRTKRKGKKILFTKTDVKRRTELKRFRWVRRESGATDFSRRGNCQGNCGGQDQTSHKHEKRKKKIDISWRNATVAD